MSQKQETILIVDDEKVIRRILRDKLSGNGYQCQEAGNANEALDKLRGTTIDLVILDIKMPGKSGAELLPEIKAGFPDTAVVMATATSDANVAIACMKNGAYDYLTKPFNLDEVVLSVGRALEKRRLEAELEDYHEHLEQKVKEQTKKIRALFLSAITALAYALEAKDEYTSGHSQRVSEISVAIARELGMSYDDVEKIRLTGLIHDIGKIGVRESVLGKPGGLTDEEFRHVKLHPEVGERILKPIVDDVDILDIVRHHHECYDGTGYPDSLKRDRIPLDARILAIADAYDAMTSQRPYRCAAMSTETACAEIERHKGTQFDPGIADALFRIRDFPVTKVA